MTSYNKHKYFKHLASQMFTRAKENISCDLMSTDNSTALLAALSNCMQPNIFTINNCRNA